MARREAVMTVLAVVAAALAMTWARGPDTEDWRYPNYIMNPRVYCPSEGSFHHPRNCSWYYRCVDRMNTGFFRTYHFECEPGTVFDDALDQCLFPYLVSPPCGTGTGVPPSPSPPTPSPPTPSPPTPSPPTPSPSPPSPSPPTPSPPTPSPPTPSPPTPSPPTPSPPTPSPPTPTPPTTDPNVPVPCTFDESNCELKEYCDPDPAIRNLCTGCFIGSAFIPTSALCNGDNKVYDKDLNQCVDLPPECPTTPPIVTPSPDNVILNENNTITCSNEKTIPDDEWIKNRHCEKYALCDASNNFLGFRNLCENYFECFRTPQNQWTYSLQDCLTTGPDYLYSFEENSCVRLDPDTLC